MSVLCFSEHTLNCDVVSSNNCFFCTTIYCVVKSTVIQSNIFYLQWVILCWILYPFAIEMFKSRFTRIMFYYILFFGLKRHISWLVGFCVFNSMNKSFPLSKKTVEVCFDPVKIKKDYTGSNLTMCIHWIMKAMNHPLSHRDKNKLIQRL